MLVSTYPIGVKGPRFLVGKAPQAIYDVPMIGDATRTSPPKLESWLATASLLATFRNCNKLLKRRGF
jgi:hypothetical protein